MNTAFFLELLLTNLEEKKGHAVFTCHARSTLEAAVAEIINEIRSCDLSKWTGNKSLLIGPSEGWRQGGGLWFPSREDRASWKLQVSRETRSMPASEDCQSKTSDQFVITEGSSMIKKKLCFVFLQLCLCICRYSMTILCVSWFL